MRYEVKFTSYRIKSVYKSLDQTVCSKTIQAPSVGGGSVIPITVPYSRKCQKRTKTRTNPYLRCSPTARAEIIQNLNDLILQKSDPNSLVDFPTFQVSTPSIEIIQSEENVRGIQKIRKNTWSNTFQSFHGG